jgi:hypothetical protein
MTKAIFAAMLLSIALMTGDAFAQSYISCRGSHGTMINQRCLDNPARLPGSCSDARQRCLGAARKARVSAQSCGAKYATCVQTSCWTYRQGRLCHLAKS